jgi:hypothetical protein
MALVPQRVSFPIAAGQEQGIAPELIDPPTLVKAHNCVYTRQGELTKRRGWGVDQDSVVNADYLPHPDRLAKRGDEILWIGEQHTQECRDRIPLEFFSRLAGESTEDSPAPIWRSKGNKSTAHSFPVPRFNIRKLTEISHEVAGGRLLDIDTAFGGASQDTHFSKGVVCVVWKYAKPIGAATTRIDYAVVDVATGATIEQKTLVSNTHLNSPLRVVSRQHADGKWYFHIYYCVGDWSGGSADLYRKTFAASTPWTIPTDASATLIASGVNNFDLCTTAHSSVDASIEQRLYLTYTRPGYDYVTAKLFTCASGGALTEQTTGISDLSTLPDPSPRTLSCACGPTGDSIGVHLACKDAGHSGPSGSDCNIVTAFDVSTGPYGLGSRDAVQTCTYTESTSSSFNPDEASNLGGTQIGWSGTTEMDSVERWDNWWITWVAYGVDWNWRCERLPATPGYDLIPQPEIATCAFRPWGRPFSYRGQSYHPVVRGICPDTVCVELIAPYSISSSSGDPPPDRYYTAGRFLQGEIAFNFSGIADMRPYPVRLGRNSIVESWVEHGRFFGAFPIVSLDGTASKLAVMDISAVDPQRLDWAEAAGGTYFAAGTPWCYDGGQGHELGFAHRPQNYLTDVTGTFPFPHGDILSDYDSIDPPFMDPGDYYVAMVWESTDSLGRVSRSAPSKAKMVTLPANQNLTVSWMTLGLTSHSKLQPVVYVSQDGGINYIRSQQVITDNPESLTIQTVTLNAYDLFVENAPSLYTDSSILENAPVHPARFATEWQNRLWLANDKDLWFSREILDGEEPSFNEALSLKLPKNCSGLVGLDDRLIVFAEDAIYWLSGDGPTDTGEGGTFAMPQRITSDYGCTDARSIVRTEKGVCFRSRRGIELIDRGLMPRLISGGVDKLLREDGYAEVISASWDQQNQICRFIARDPTHERYLVLCWHTLFELWTTADVPTVGDLSSWGGHLYFRSAVPVGIVSALGTNWMAFGDNPVFAASPQCAIAREFRPDAALYLDYHYSGSTSVPSWYQMVVETANVKFDGLTGFARVWRANVTVKGLNGLTGVALNYVNDYGATPTARERQWKTAEEIAAGATQSADHWRYGIHIDKQQCSAQRLVIKDLQLDDGTATVYQTTMTLVGFGFEWGQVRGTGRGREGAKK